MNAGEVIDAVVTAIEGYGVRLEHHGLRILVMAPEVSWIPDPRGEWYRGIKNAARKRVKILSFVHEKNEFIGSFRQAHPEDNPWKDPSRFACGTHWHGVVTHRLHGDDPETIVSYMIEIAPGVSGHITKDCIAHLDLGVGDPVDVIVGHVDAASQRIELLPED